jgi:hypothetical protein
MEPTPASVQRLNEALLLHAGCIFRISPISEPPARAPPFTDNLSLAIGIGSFERPVFDRFAGSTATKFGGDRLQAAAKLSIKTHVRTNLRTTLR